MDGNTTIAIVTGIILPPILSVAYGLKLPANYKAVITLIIAAILGYLVQVFDHGDWTVNRDELVKSFAIIYTTASVSLSTFWKPTGIDKNINKNVIPDGLIPFAPTTDTKKVV